MTDRQEFVAGLRAAADFFEDTNVDLPSGVDINVFLHTKEEMAKAARAAGSLKKCYLENWFVLRKEFGGGVSVEFNASRDKICQRIVTGTRTVIKPKMVQDGEETVEEDIVEWRCDEPLLAHSSGDNHA